MEKIQHFSGTYARWFLTFPSWAEEEAAAPHQTLAADAGRPGPD
jgi:hypothetical protein